MKQKSKNKENLSGYHTGDKPNIACVDSYVSLIDLIQSRTTCEGITTLHINLCIA